ncbi:hypothetical protein ACFYL6_24460 [Micromonospora sp. NPDC007208]|uniref:hypothetical protein n=1 Tax=Micromonospora sp. NPDC007208 TaxID=3364236 RepID=UPI0036B84905
MRREQMGIQMRSSQSRKRPDPRQLAADILHGDSELHAQKEATTDRGAWTVARRAVLFDDYSAIRLMDQIPYPDGFQLRARLRAGGDDIIVSRPRPPAGFDEYYSGRLGLGDPVWLHPDSATDLCSAAWSDSRTSAALVEAARGGAYLHPYHASEAAWQLADRLSRAARLSVPVLGPPPRLCQLANDKSWFLSTVADLLGAEAIPRLRVTRRFADVPAAIEEISRHSPKLAVRIPDSAGGLGMRVFATDVLRRLDRRALTAWAADVYRDLGLRDDSAVLVTSWEETLAAPSIEVTIAPGEAAAPTCGRVIDQIFTDADRSQFGGGVAGALPPEIVRRLRSHASTIAVLLQALGYLGRLSFDFIVTGRSLADADVRVVDCNARWSGGSVLGAMLDRLFPNRSQPYAFGALRHPQLRSIPFDVLIDRLEGRLWNPSTRRGDLLVHNVGHLAASGRADIVVLADSAETARHRLANLSGSVADGTAALLLAKDAGAGPATS